MQQEKKRERETERQRNKPKIQSKIILGQWQGEGHNCVVLSKAVVMFYFLK